MIMYATKQTAERLNLPLIEDFKTETRFFANAVFKSEEKDDLLSWGLKLFYFDRLKCVQAVNFASKFTIFMLKLKVSDNLNLPNMLANYIFSMYEDDKKMKPVLERYFASHPTVVFTKIKDKSMIATMNATQRFFLCDGYRVYDFTEGNVIQSLKLNRSYNFRYPVQQRGSKEYIYPAEEFKKILLKRYG